MTIAVAPADGAVEDLVGSRVLAGIQLINISRLSTHPVPITPRGLITVAGQGPSDSNGAGKSSFIAGLSLLHADDQWRLQSGAQAAAELLFTAELAGQEAMHANAERGYLVGVFLPPDSATVEQFEAATLTVWLRINRQSPHLELRWADRLHVAYGDTESERAAGADALWDELPRSSGRTDIKANRLARTLYGGTVRCVSFLSTSVRASPTANLLAQPLNELSPERIFDAVGALTGLTREIELEQKARAEEYTHAEAARTAQEEYERWDQRMTLVERGIAAREQARTLLAAARDGWRARCARHLVDGVREDEDVAADLAVNERSREELELAVEVAGEQVSRLSDDRAFDSSVRARVKAYEGVKGEVDALRREQDRNVGSAEVLTQRARALRDEAAAADGRDLDQAGKELREAEDGVRAAERLKGRTEDALATATTALAAAERGEDVAVEQVRALRAAGVTAVPLVDVISLTEQQRPVWEARLLPYRHAVVVPPGETAEAVRVLASLPGSLLVAGDSASPDRFLAALEERAGQAGDHIDTAAGVHGVAGLPEALTGRAGRIRAARAALEQASGADGQADEAIREAKRARDRAAGRVAGARAAAEADAIDAQIGELRAHHVRIEDALDSLAVPLQQATDAYKDALGEQAARGQQIDAAKTVLANLRKELEQNRERWQLLTQRRAALDLPRRQAAWAGTTASAEQHLTTLDERDQLRPAAEWDDLCAGLADQARHACFPAGTPDEQLPEELRVVDEQRRDRRSPAYLRLIPDLVRIVGQYLDERELVDRQSREQIGTERAAKTRTLAGARAALEEARLASNALRATTATAIRTKLRQVSDEFDRLDATYGGYGGGLDFPEPEAPADPQKPWQWAITPKWRRGEGKPLSSYRLRGNTAQMDDKAVKLVCAAALAGSHDRPLMLVLDELGRNLGSAHRRDAVALFENIGRDRAISVVGALQDDMERYAVGASSLYVKLRRPSDVVPYNQAPVVIGSDADAARVRLLAGWMTSFRPAPRT